MRHGIVAAAILATLIVLPQMLGLIYEHATNAALSDDAQLAIELRCRDQPAAAARECESMLKRLFLAGSLEPDQALQSYCESYRDGRWGGSRPEPPRVCVQRFGGWARTPRK